MKSILQDPRAKRYAKALASGASPEEAARIAGGYPPGCDPKGARPTYFRARCMEAALRRNPGGYFDAGWHLGAHTDGEVCEDASLDELADACDESNLDAIVRWYAEWLPRCMKLVPPRRRRQFARGVLTAYLTRGIGDWGGDLTEDEASEAVDATRRR